jgi:O-antigen ligase
MPPTSHSPSATVSQGATAASLTDRLARGEMALRGWIDARLDAVSVALAATLVVSLGYVFGYEFWSARFGPLPLTLDRLGAIGVLGIVGWRIVRRRMLSPCWTLVDWALAALLVWLSLSTVWAMTGGRLTTSESPLWRLVFSFWLPALFYVAVRLAEVTHRATVGVLATLAGLGLYLAITGLAEATQQWWCVFPSFIRDPELGTHFGRARGPALNSVSLGTHLCVSLWAAFLLRDHVRRPVRLLLWLAMGLMALALLATYTRSVWMGAALSGLVILAIRTPKHLRLPVLGGTTAAGILLAAIGWNYLVYLDREDSGAVSGHSVSQREAFTYVSWNMFCDHPAVGVGFGRFYDRKLPYLSDRRQAFEIESLRDLHHHNTFLGLLVETGLIGMACFIALLAGWARMAYRTATAAHLLPVQRSLGCLLIATLALYLPSAVFHDVTHIFQDQWLLFVVAGLGVAAWEQGRLVSTGSSGSSTSPLTTDSQLA